MEREYPALRIQWLTAPEPARIEELLAFLDDETPTAVEEHESGMVVFFPNAERRDRAADIARSFAPEASVRAVSVSDEAWAARSQASLTAIRVNRVVVTPPWARQETLPSDEDIVITIVPSMGFGTGHHASTRLCLRLLQRLDVRGRSVLDVGTGSGVLAIAAWRLGAARVVGIDVDADALASARENVELNGAEGMVQLRELDLAQASTTFITEFDVAVANLTGAMIERYSSQLRSTVVPGGSLILSGFQIDDEDAARHALVTGAATTVSDRVEEDGWVAMQLTSN